jgi:hypothetical protein
LLQERLPPFALARQQPEFPLRREKRQVAPHDLAKRGHVERAAELTSQRDEPFELLGTSALPARFDRRSNGGSLGVLPLAILVKRQRGDEDGEPWNQVELVPDFELPRKVEDEVQRSLKDHERAGNQRDGKVRVIPVKEAQRRELSHGLR